jgi:predicted ATP-grasp superfamily ATP-dependent carboligase
MKKPVLILGMVPRITTPVARSLARHGIAVDVATFSTIERNIGSRAIRNFWQVPNPEISSPAFVDALRTVIRQNQHDMLIPANDLALSAIVEHYDSFKNLVHIACPPPEITRRVLDKSQTLEAARRCGIRVPRTFLVSSSAELSEIARDLNFPIVLKPSEKTAADEFKTCVIGHRQTLQQRFHTSRRFIRPMLVQEFCAGHGVGIELLMHGGEPVVAFQHHRLKELPPAGGVAVVAIAEALNPELLNWSVELLRALKWEGVAMVEFKVDAITGTATLMEVNGRYWGTISLPIQAGLDFPLYHWAVVHGEVPEIPATYRIATQWRWSAGWISRWHDLLLDALRGPVDRNRVLKELKRIPSDFTSSICDALFSVEDPMPGILECLRTIKDLAISDMRRVLRFRRSLPATAKNISGLTTLATNLREAGDAKIDAGH